MLDFVDYINLIQTEVDQNCRSTLIDWMVEVGLDLRLRSETLFLAKHYLDRYLSIKPIQQTKLQLVAATCLFLAT
jgi:hypothetical protein